MLVMIGETELDFPSDELRELRDANAQLDDADALRARMDEDGYLLLRGLIDRERVSAARRSVFEQMRDEGDRAFQPGTELMDGVHNPGGKPPATMGRRPVTHEPRVRRVLEGPELFGFFERYFGEPARTFDYKWLRALRPGEFTGAHYDFVYMGRGSRRLHTVWVPMGDLTPDLGSLAVCVGSHNLPGFAKLRDTYGRMDVDRDRVQGWLTGDPREVTSTFGGAWHTTNYRAGDVMIFGMHTMHVGTRNLTDRFRLSCDVRFQPAADPVDDRWVGENPIAHYGWHEGQTVSMTEARAKWGV